MNRERDKLLQEFLLAREELKTQFDCEKREIIGNYERRIHYLTRMLEQCDENTNMLKLNLEAEKEQNFILKTNIMGLRRNEHCSSHKSRTGSLQHRSYSNKCFDKESFPSSPYITNEAGSSKSIEKSSVAGLKYSDRIASCGSLQTSLVTSSSYSDCNCASITNADDGNLHENCREEFSRLLEELRRQQAKFDAQMKEEKRSMLEQLQNEKLQMERVVYKQLNVRLECEVKKQEMLLIENAHLRRTISNAIMKRISSKEIQQHENTDNKFKEKWNDTLPWKETNSDSGADVDADNRSDEDGSDMSDSGKSSLTLSDRALNSSWLHQQKDDDILLTSISKLMQKSSHENLSIAHEQHHTSINHQTITTDMSFTDLHQNNSPYFEMAHFNEELKNKLQMLEKLLVEGEESAQRLS